MNKCVCVLMFHKYIKHEIFAKTLNMSILGKAHITTPHSNFVSFSGLQVCSGAC